ncbi:MAG: hypothetical protein AAGJ81_04040 [Verrucomicrobiota bacterium]
MEAAENMKTWTHPIFASFRIMRFSIIMSFILVFSICADDLSENYYEHLKEVEFVPGKVENFSLVEAGEILLEYLNGSIDKEKWEISFRLENPKREIPDWYLERKSISFKITTEISAYDYLRTICAIDDVNFLLRDRTIVFFWGL